MEGSSIFRLTIAFLAMFCSVLGSGQSSAQNIEERQRMDLWLRNLVKIRVGADQSAFGLIVGRKGENLWIAVPAHTVFDSWPVGKNPKPASKIAVRFSDSPDEYMAIEEPVPDAFAMDLAFFPIKVPLAPNQSSFDRWFESVLDACPKEGNQVWIGGIGSAIAYSSRSGRIHRLQREDGESLADELRAIDGQSGGIVATGRGIVGLYLGMDRRSRQARVLSVTHIRKSALEGSVPWQLRESGMACGSTVEVCVKNSGPEFDPFWLMGAEGRFDPDPSGCYRIREGSYRIANAAPIFVQCSPGVLQVRSALANTVIHISCNPVLTGVWQSREAGDLEVQAPVNDVAQFRGLHLSPKGTIIGRIEVSTATPEMQLFGRTVPGQDVFGEVRVQRRRLSVTINYMDGERKTFELHR